MNITLLRNLAADLNKKDNRLAALLDQIINSLEELQPTPEEFRLDVPYTDVPFVAGDYTANAPMVWAVAAPLDLYGYHVSNGMMTMQWRIDNSTLAGAGTNQLNIAIPPGYRPRIRPDNNVNGIFTGIHYFMNGGVWNTGPVHIASDTNFVRLFTPTLVAFASPDAGFITRGSIQFPVERSF